ncbi:MAG TPA: hypothetical protein VKY73_23135 [Polyangiaceae bacterium]|nr:hypothetical protein [Polyangiaceae bacterium]
MSRARAFPLVRRAIALLYVVAVFYGGTANLGPLPQTAFIASDKLGHVLAFAGLELAFELAWLELRPGVRRALAILASLGVGLALELVQAGLPHRAGDPLDFVADAIGTLLGALVATLLGRNAARHRRATPSRSS